MTTVDRLRIDAGWLIDGTGSPAKRRCRIHILGGRIERITNGKETHGDAANLVDASGCTLLPCLMDAHIHLFMSPTADPDRRQWQQTATYEDLEPLMARRVERMTASGVIAARDGGDAAGHAFRYGERMEKQKGSGFILRSPETAWHAPGRYGQFVGKTPPAGLSLADAVERFSDGIDHVKIIQSGLNSLTEFGRETKPQFTSEELRRTVIAAESRGLPVMVHANGAAPVRAAIEAGVGSIEHGYFMGTDNIRRLAESKIFWVPTVMPMHAAAGVSEFDEKIRDVASRTRDHQLQQVADAHGAGAKIALGTDAGGIGVVHGTAVAEEMVLLRQAGLSIEAVVAAATGEAADLLRLGDLGCAIPGKRACLIAVPGPPEDLPRSLDGLAWVMVDGKMRS